MSEDSNSIVRRVRDFYDQAGAHFSKTRQKKYGSGSSNWSITDQYLRKLRPGDRVLDAGCGNGKLVTGLPKGVIYTGFDFSQTMLDEAKSLHPEYDFRQGDVLDTKVWDRLGEFEAIFCVAVLHHIPTRELQEKVLRKAKEHLAPNGFLYLTVWNLWQERFLKYHLDNHAEIPYNKKWSRYCETFDLPNMRDLLQATGWEIEEIFYADRDGIPSKITDGQNLVVVAR